MHKVRPFSLIAALSLLTAGCAAHPQRPDGDPPMQPDADALTYPPAEREAVVDTFHGVEVADPYRWLESPDDPRTRAWVAAENAVTRRFIDASSAREAIAARLTTLWDYTRIAPPHQSGGALYYLKNDGLSAQSILYRVPEGGGDEEVVLDPNTFSDDGTVALVRELVFSPEGRYLAYGVSDGGSDWTTWKIRDLRTLTDLPDEMPWSKFAAPAWLGDESGLFYGRYPVPDNPLEGVNLGNQLLLHRLGQPAAADTLIYERPDEPTWDFQPAVTPDGGHLVITVGRSTEERNLIYIKDLSRDDAPVEHLIGAWDFQFRYISKAGGEWFFWTDADAPRGRIIGVNPADPSPGAWRDVVPEGPDTIEEVAAAGGGFAVSYLHDATSRLAFFGADGASRGEAALPALGTADFVEADWRSDQVFFRFSSFATPERVLRHDLGAGETSTFQAPEVGFDPEDFVTTQEFYPSADGTRIPMFITRHKGTQPTGDAPTILYGYGGFNIAVTPGFKVENLVWMELGGVFAVANLRGGAEYGREWHEAGILTHKQNVFDDFIAGAEHLIASGWTRPDRLAIEGRSNGGLLVGATMLQRPDLFGAALPGVGVMDMLRYHLFTIGWAWASDYGTVDDPEQFKALLAYSPVHNVKEGAAYPATLITTAARDDRVVPAHSFKFAAALQHGQGGDAPVLIRVETRAGHGAGKPTAMKVDEAADTLTFLVETLHIPLPQEP